MTQRLRNSLTIGSRIAYIFWRAAKIDWPLVLTMRTGGRLRVRPPPATDLSTAYELFVDEVYKPAREAGLAGVSRIVDLGANVGFSVLYFARQFPLSRIVAFEPHPVNLSCLRENIALNGFAHRVRVVGAAAATTDGFVGLSDSENTSSIVRGESGIPVPARDLFAELGPEPVDILKIDIEGAEYALLSDPRFDVLRPRFIIMEWHGTHSESLGAEWCKKRFENLGYDVTTGGTGDFNGLAIGTLWARRPD